jgi:hypothetical protein
VGGDEVCCRFASDLDENVEDGRLGVATERGGGGGFRGLGRGVGVKDSLRGTRGEIGVGWNPGLTGEGDRVGYGLEL